MSKKHIDPEYERYKRNDPSFPGVQTCVDLLRRRNVKGSYLDAVLWDLENHASDVSDELIEAFREEKDLRIKNILLSTLAEAKIHDALLIFVEYLTGSEEELRTWAAFGLHKLDTKEARRFLWQAQSHQFSNLDETKRFQQMLNEVKQWDK